MARNRVVVGSMPARPFILSKVSLNRSLEEVQHYCCPFKNECQAFQLRQNKLNEHSLVLKKHFANNSFSLTVIKLVCSIKLWCLFSLRN